MTPIEQAIAALEHGMTEAAIVGYFPIQYTREALAILRSIPGPATEEEIRASLQEYLIEDGWIMMSSYQAGFRAAEARHGRKG